MMYAVAHRGSLVTEPAMKTGKPRRQSGFAYFGLLFSVTAAALAVSAGSHLLGNETRREKELELLNCGDDIRRAIESYHAKNAAGMSPFPTRLEWLIRDPHQPTVMRHLRRICVEPMQEHGPEGFAKMGGWALILDANGQIVGVHPESMRQPLKRSGFAATYDEFRNAVHYADWRFVAAGGVPAKTNANASATRATGNFIPSGGLLAPLLAPFQTATPPVPPTPPAPAPAPAAALPREPAPELAPAPVPVPVAAPSVATTEAVPAPVAQSAAPAAATPNPGAGAGAASGSGPPPAADAPSGGVQPFVMRSPSGW